MQKDPREGRGTGNVPSAETDTAHRTPLPRRERRPAGMDPPMSPTGVSGGSKLRDVGRTVSAEAATHIAKLKKSDRAKQVVEKSVAWGADALEDPTATAEKLKQAAGRLWTEDEKVQALKDRGRNMLENALQDEQKMEKVREREREHGEAPHVEALFFYFFRAWRHRHVRSFFFPPFASQLAARSKRTSASRGLHGGMRGRISDGSDLV